MGIIHNLKNAFTGSSNKEIGPVLQTSQPSQPAVGYDVRRGEGKRVDIYGDGVFYTRTNNGMWVWNAPSGGEDEIITDPREVSFLETLLSSVPGKSGKVEFYPENTSNCHTSVK